jgi:hypothetical protein
MTYQFTADSSIDNLLKMTNDVMMKIKLQTQEMSL